MDGGLRPHLEDRERRRNGQFQCPTPTGLVGAELQQQASGYVSVNPALRVSGAVVTNDSACARFDAFTATTKLTVWSRQPNSLFLRRRVECRIRRRVTTATALRTGQAVGTLRPAAVSLVAAFQDQGVGSARR